LANLADEVREILALPNLVAVIGPVRSSTAALQTQQLLSARSQVPHFSIFATTAELSSRARYPTHYRTIQAIPLVAAGMVDLVVSQHWRGAALLYSQSEFGTQGAIAIRDAARRRRLRIVVTSILTDAEPSSVRQALDAVRETGAKVLLCFPNHSDFFLIAREARELGMLGNGYVWILPYFSADHGAYTAEELSLLLGAFNVNVLPQTHLAEFQALAQRLPLVLNLSSLVQVYDSARAITAALGRVPANVSANDYAALHAELRQTRITGASGPISFDAQGDRVGPVDVIQFQLRQDAVIAMPVGVLEAEGSFSNSTALQFFWGSSPLFTPPPAFAADTCGSDVLFRNVSEDCEPCPRGHFNPRSDGRDACVACPIGTALEVLGGTAVCEPCGPGLRGVLLPESNIPGCLADSDTALPVAIIVGNIAGALVLGALAWLYLYVMRLRSSESASRAQLQRQAAFLSYVFHELRNPVNGIVGFLEVATEKLVATKAGVRATLPAAMHPVPSPALESESLAVGTAMPARPSADDVLELLYDARASAERVMQVQTQVMLLAKLAENSLRPLPVPVELRGFLENLIARVREAIPDTQRTVVTLEFGASCDECSHVILDVKLLERVLVGLLSNAIKHSPDGLVMARVELLPAMRLSSNGECEENGDSSRHARPLDVVSDEVGLLGRCCPALGEAAQARDAHHQERLRFVVRDSGPGISKDDSALIAHSLTDVVIKPGVGLGLILSGRLVQLLGGRLCVRSPCMPDRSGAEFFFSLPLCRPSLDVPREHQAACEGPTLESDSAEESATQSCTAECRDSLALGVLLDSQQEEPPVVAREPRAAARALDAVRVSDKAVASNHFEVPLARAPHQRDATSRASAELESQELYNERKEASAAAPQPMLASADDVPRQLPQQQQSSAKLSDAHSAAHWVAEVATLFPNTLMCTPADPLVLSSASNPSLPPSEVLSVRLPASWRVLVVDDMQVNIKVVQKKMSVEPFRALAWTIDGAPNGEAALRILTEEQKHYDLVLLDQIMTSSGGKLLGTETLQRLRIYYQQAGVPAAQQPLVIGYTAAGEETQLEFDFRWTKPLPDSSTMARDIERILELRARPAGSA
jgi:signal transduction histidine kinase/ABC-type branched-subunit amino acid transport system substrate-binding protein/CheY-like chemotaxis protein